MSLWTVLARSCADPTFPMLDVPRQGGVIANMLAAPIDPHGWRIPAPNASCRFDALVRASATGIAALVCRGTSLVIRIPGSVSIGRDPASEMDVLGTVPSTIFVPLPCTACHPGAMGSWTQASETCRCALRCKRAAALPCVGSSWRHRGIFKMGRAYHGNCWCHPSLKAKLLDLRTASTNQHDARHDLSEIRTTTWAWGRNDQRVHLAVWTGSEALRADSVTRASTRLTY
jgi:hypothetical protein